MRKPKVSVIIPVYNVEEYIYDMLSSVRAQSFKDYEVILVNDGSTDGSGNIIDLFCREDSRFRAINKENGGVASARNRGIDEAKGEYIVFYDPDDYIPSDALEKMYRTASKEHADIVVGVMVEKSLGETMIYMNTQILARLKKINPFDEHFLGAWSLCHKMFSKKLIKDNDIRFQNLLHAEDGVFCFSALNYAEKICGCNYVVYEYIKRPFWMSPSATQKISGIYLDSLILSYNTILDEAEKLALKYGIDKETYLSKLYIRFIEVGFLNEYYRFIWRSDNSILPCLTNMTSEYKRHIYKKQWDNMVYKNRYLQFEKGYQTIEELKKHINISVIISDELCQYDAEKVIGSLYYQYYLLFEIIVPSNIYEKLNHELKCKANIYNIDYDINTAYKNAKGEYIIFVNEPVIYTKNTLKQMEAVMHKNETLDFVSILLKTFDGDKFNDIPAISAAFGYTKGGKTKNTVITSADIFMSNKLLRKSSFKEFVFTGKGELDSQALYRKFNFEKIRKGTMVTTLSEEDILNRSNCHTSALVIKFKYIKNRGISRAIEKAKRIITKEDIENIKKKLGK